VEEKPNKSDGASNEPEANHRSWRDESLSDDALADIEGLLWQHWSDLSDQRDLTTDQKWAKPLVRAYLYARLEIISMLKAARLGIKRESRSSDLEEAKNKVLQFVAKENFSDCLKWFGITDGHPLSPVHLFEKEIANQTNDSSKTSVTLAELLPHYISPWKNALLLALLAKGIGADYLAISQYISGQLAFIQLPDYCAGHRRESLDYMVASVPDQAGKLIPRYPDIQSEFQRDLTKVRKDIERRLQKYLRLASE
jgi:hypothetical protein